jgi:hypothetical protein
MSYVYALLVGLSLGHFLLGLPIQYSDSFGQMLKLSASWSDLLYGEFTQRGFMRPFDWSLMKLVYDLSGGNYFAWFRGAHVVQVVALLLLFVALVRPRTLQDVALLPLGFAVLIGVHTFQGTIREAFPINHFLQVLLFCLAAAVVVLRPHSRWNDVAAAILFVASALTLESGLLVWVILVGGVVVGGRGISRGGIGVLCGLLVVYFLLRFLILDVGSPGLMERSSGFGFSMLEPPELLDRFGANPLPFYAYNVLSSILSVLLSEPQGGVFRFTQRMMEGDVGLAHLVNPIASAAATLLIVAFVWRRRHAWLTRQFTRDDQLVALFAIVLCANAVISFPYVKDVVMSPAGAFFAVAVFVAARDAMGRLPLNPAPPRPILIVAFFALLGTTWAIRLAGAHLDLRTAAHGERTEWVYVEHSDELSRMGLTDTEAVLFRRLRNDAIFVHPAPPPLNPPLRDLLTGGE